MFRQVPNPCILLSWILTVFVSSVVQGQIQVIGAPQLIRAHVGADVTLPCECDRPVDLTPLTVEWSHTARGPRPSDPLKRRRFVHVYTDYRDDDPDMKLEEFTNRTRLSTERLAQGGASLRILHVSLADNGTYKCFIPNLETKRSQRWTLVTLIVEDPDTTTAPPSTPDLNHRAKNLDPTNPDPPTLTMRSYVVTATIVPMFLLLLGIFALLVWCKKVEPEPEKKNYFPHETQLLPCVKLDILRPKA